VAYVNAYERTQGYGGPEEGGWWFDVLTPLASIPVMNTDDEAIARRLIEAAFREEYNERRPYYSATGDGADLVVALERRMAEPSPTERPHYE
jgi:hypothetical protein